MKIASHLHFHLFLLYLGNTGVHLAHRHCKLLLHLVTHQLRALEFFSSPLKPL